MCLAQGKAHMFCLDDTIGQGQRSTPYNRFARNDWQSAHLMRRAGIIEGSRAPSTAVSGPSQRAALLASIATTLLLQGLSTASIHGCLSTGSTRLRPVKESIRRLRRFHRFEAGRSSGCACAPTTCFAPFFNLCLSAQSADLMKNRARPATTLYRLAAAKRSATADQLTTFQNAAMYSGRRFWYFR